MANIESLVNKVTDKNNVSEDWSTIMELCDFAQSGSAREIINCLKKKLNDQNSNVLLYSLTLADSLVKNCKIEVHREISSRGFLDILVKQISNKNVHEIVKEKILSLIKQWTETFKYDHSLR